MAERVDVSIRVELRWLISRTRYEALSSEVAHHNGATLLHKLSLSDQMFSIGSFNNDLPFIHLSCRMEGSTTLRSPLVLVYDVTGAACEAFM